LDEPPRAIVFWLLVCLRVPQSAAVDSQLFPGLVLGGMMP
jgi:hypothetical protein